MKSDPRHGELSTKYTEEPVSSAACEQRRKIGTMPSHSPAGKHHAEGTIAATKTNLMCIEKKLKTVLKDSAGMPNAFWW